MYFKKYGYGKLTKKLQKLLKTYTMTQINNSFAEAMETKGSTDLNKIVEEYRTAIVGRIRFIMRKRHINQNELASLMGIKQSHISRIITGKMNVTIDVLIKMMYYLDSSLEFNDDKEKSIKVWGNSMLRIRQNMVQHTLDCRERYSLQYINSAPTLIAV